MRCGLSPWRGNNRRRAVWRRGEQPLACIFSPGRLVNNFWPRITACALELSRRACRFSGTDGGRCADASGSYYRPIARLAPLIQGISRRLNINSRHQALRPGRRVMGGMAARLPRCLPGQSACGGHPLLKTMVKQMLTFLAKTARSAILKLMARWRRRGDIALPRHIALRTANATHSGLAGDGTRCSSHMLRYLRRPSAGMRTLQEPTPAAPPSIWTSPGLHPDAFISSCTFTSYVCRYRAHQSALRNHWHRCLWRLPRYPPLPAGVSTISPPLRSRTILIFAAPPRAFTPPSTRVKTSTLQQRRDRAATCFLLLTGIDV